MNHTHTHTHTHTHFISVTPAANDFWRHNHKPACLLFFFHPLVRTVSHIHRQALWIFALYAAAASIPAPLTRRYNLFSASGDTDEWQEGAGKWKQNKATALSCLSFGLSPGVLPLENTCCIVRFFYGASPFRNELCSGRWWGDNDVLCVCVVVGAGKGQYAVPDRSGRFSDVLLCCNVKRGKDMLWVIIRKDTSNKIISTVHRE